jgi:hypothetical protein
MAADEYVRIKLDWGWRRALSDWIRSDKGSSPDERLLERKRLAPSKIMFSKAPILGEE